MAFRMTGIAQLLRRHGRNVTVTFGVTPSVYNPETGEVEGGEVISHTVKGYFYDSTKDNVFDTQIENTQRRLILKTTDITNVAIPKPTVGNTVTAGGDVISIYRVDEIASGEQVLFYICRLVE